MSGSKIEENSCEVSSSRELITAKDARKLAEKRFGRDVEVLDYTVDQYAEEKLGFLGSHQRLVVTVREKADDNSAPISSLRYFVKAMPYEVSTQADYVSEKGVFKQETYFFEKVVPELSHAFNCSEPWAPKCYIIKDDCLVFEDIGMYGFGMRPKLLNEDEIRAGLGTIARYHGASLHAEARLGRPLNKLYPNAFEERAFLHRGNQYRWYLAGVDVAVKIAQLLGLDAKAVPAACDRVFDAMKPSLSKQNVASHGDLWSNNLMFDKSSPPRCRLVDFQLARYSPLGHDVAQFMYLCGSREFRQKRELQMLRYYYQCLKDSLDFGSTIFVETPSWRDLQLSYEEQRLGALVTAIMYFPTVLLDGLTGAKIMNDPETYKEFVTVDRRDQVLENMQRDPEYRQRLNETVRELVEMSHKLEELPQPC
ncbi:uncharacterized protein [Venturia canescens]|uniref:uncharacterized protein n=1 Tax=Venturia canescens TaxID=32260 RepID=UPI001C9C7088|nr:uncharacterized protein LOC122414308 [Venturia canescens]